MRRTSTFSYWGDSLRKMTKTSDHRLGIRNQGKNAVNVDNCLGGEGEKLAGRCLKDTRVKIEKSQYVFSRSNRRAQRVCGPRMQENREHLGDQRRREDRPGGRAKMKGEGRGGRVPWPQE